MNIPTYATPGATVTWDGDTFTVVATSEAPAVLLEAPDGDRIMVAAHTLSPAPVTTADLLDEYAQALRGAWGGIDGRSEKAKLADLSALIRTQGAEPLDEQQITTARDNLGICPTGGGHWTDFCDSSCNGTKGGDA